MPMRRSAIHISRFGALFRLTTRAIYAHFYADLCSVAIDKYRYNHRRKRHSDCIMFSELEDVQQPTGDDDTTVPELTEYIDEFLRQTGAEARVLFIRRYFMSESVQSLAERFGMSENSVSVKLFRTRKALRKCILKKGVSV